MYVQFCQKISHKKILQFLRICIIQMAQIIVCKESRKRVGKKLLPTKQLSNFFTMSSVLEKQCEKTRSNHSEVFLQCFSQKSAYPWKEPVKEYFFSKIAIQKYRALLILISYTDILPRVFLKFWVFSDNFLKFLEQILSVRLLHDYFQPLPCQAYYFCFFFIYFFIKA